MNKKQNNKKAILVIILVICIIVAVITLVTRKETENKKIKTDTKIVTSKYKMTGNSLQDFDLSFLNIENTESNMIYSPLSIKYTLAMLSEGAAGLSKQQVDAVIGNYKSKKYTNSANMSFANAMFIRESYRDKIKSSYVNNINKKYNIDLVYDTFKSTDVVNSWVNNKTFGLISNLVDDLSEVNYVLANALAIDMEWVKKIQPTIDKDLPFRVVYQHENFDISVWPIELDEYPTLKFNNKIDAKSVELVAAINNYDIIKELGEDSIRDTISKEYTKWLSEGGCGDDLPVSEYVDKYIEEINSNYQRVDTSTDFSLNDDENVKVFAKDLKEYKGTTLQYVGIMPKKEELSSFINNNDAKSLNAILNNLKTLNTENFPSGTVTKIEGNIPLFKFDYKLELIDDLKKLGITDVFSKEKANLSNLTEEKGSYIAEADHKANIEFSNEGIKAAAATTVGGYGSTSCSFIHDYDIPVQVIDITFDKPYLFLIRDKNTGEVWFVGKVITPTTN